jgi:hypothetical protein
MHNTQYRIQQFTGVSYSGKAVLKKYSLTQFGYWKILGEDSNADLHGSHHQPDLGTVQGVLSDVIEYAVDLKGFWQWGRGGDIILLGEEIPLINQVTIAEKRQLLQQQKDLQQQLKEVEAKLK